MCAPHNCLVKLLDYQLTQLATATIQCLCILVTNSILPSISCQLIGRKSNPIFSPVKIPYEGSVALMQRVDNIEQCSDV